MRRAHIHEILIANRAQPTRNWTLQALLATLGYTLLVAIGLLAIMVQLARAAGPKYVAGVSYFDPATVGTPLVWSNGLITYFTDQGNLSPTMPGPAADAFVADALSQWTSIPTAAVAAFHGGQLAEDVNGSNVFVNSDGSITEPADIMPDAIATPLGIVYDYDGSVTDAFLGQGAGDATECFGNAVFGGLDNFAANATFLHALIVINGNCLQTSSQTPDVEYRLVRTLGRVFGLDWSQVNLNVVTNNPPPTSDDYLGFPVMHDVDSTNCVPITICYSNNGAVNPYVPKMDDQAALSGLYPVTPQNINNFTGKQITAQTTGAIQGSLFFVTSNGQSGQPMQGVNVVARWIDPNTGLPSRQYASASVSGFLYTGNAGNMATGYDDPTGNRFDQWGSNQVLMEGSYSLPALQIPNGSNSTQYQISVEGLDPIWSEAVGPYGPWQVTPSGIFSPTPVTVMFGSTSTLNIMMQNSKVAFANLFGPTTYQAPALLPLSGDWIGTLNGYGDTDYLQFTAQANRTLSVEVTALNESGVSSESKSQPVVGMWALADPGVSPAPANTPSAFNTTFFGVTRLDASILQSTAFRVGVGDYRGDGRPDYAYHARLFYGDSVTPARASVAGGTAIGVLGYGFQNNSTLNVAGTNLALLSQTSNQIVATTQPRADGLQNIVLTDADVGGSSTMTGALTIGAGLTDTIRLLSGTNQKAPVGGQAPNPIVMQAVTANGITPVGGASVFFTATPPVAFSACGGASSCTVITDDTGQVSTFLTVLSTGVMRITAELAPATYRSPQEAIADFVGTSSSLDIALTPQNTGIAQGANLSFPLTARVLSNGVPQPNRTVDYILVKGAAKLSAASATTDSNGYATSTLEITNMSGDVQVAACVGPQNVPCLTFYGTSVPDSVIQLQGVAGISQLVLVGQPFQPVTVRAVDNSSPPLPVLAAPVGFESIVGRINSNVPVITIGELNITQPDLPIILSSTLQTITSDSDGLATFQPNSGVQGATVILGTAAIGAGSVNYQLQSLWPENQ